MASINSGKVLAGGVLAGVVMNVIDYVSNNFILAKDWQNVAQLRNIDITVMGGTPAIVTAIAVDVMLGMLIVVMYAAMRPRFGAGPGTAAIAGFTVFLSAALVMATLAGSFFSWDLYIRWAALFLVSALAGGLSGGWVYSEDVEPRETADD
jgi:hypothetical protein